MRNRNNLAARLDAVESRLVGRFDRALTALSDEDRATYDKYWRERNAWLQEQSPETVYLSLTNNAGPRLPERISSKLFGVPVRMYKGDDARTKYERFKDERNF